jgi:two-component system chemotaxis response regulator CheY
MKKKILIVDDTAVARKILKSCIPRAEEYDFFEAEDGLAFKTVQPDITFLDINMPNMDGMECLERIKNVAPNACVIMCSGDIQPQSLDRATALGALSIIKKPPTRESIQKALAKII